jgi:hypothetical protein
MSKFSSTAVSSSSSRKAVVFQQIVEISPCQIHVGVATVHGGCKVLKTGAIQSGHHDLTVGIAQEIATGCRNRGTGIGPYAQDDQAVATL